MAQTLYTTWARLFSENYPTPHNPALTQAIDDTLTRYGYPDAYILPNGEIVGPYAEVGDFQADLEDEELKEALAMAEYDVYTQ